MAPRAVIFGCRGPDLGDGEAAFLRDADPWGFILFARNVETPDRLRRLTGALREAVGREAPVLIDQEGGRVARMRAPVWRDWEPALDEVRRLVDPGLRPMAMRLRYRLIAEELRGVGIDVNCAPILDVLWPDTHPFLRSRLYGADPGEVAAIGRAVADGLMAGGVLPVMKHVPGHGRAASDSHASLPVVDADEAALEADLAPFQALADLPMAMTAHVLYRAIDPAAPGTLSPAVIRLVRERIGFGGLLMTDDLSMGALSGPVGARAARALAAGCDIALHCNGEAGEMEEVAAAAPRLAGAAAARAEAALAARGTPAEVDVAALARDYAALRAAHA